MMLLLLVPHYSPVNYATGRSGDEAASPQQPVGVKAGGVSMFDAEVWKKLWGDSLWKRNAKLKRR